MRDITIVPQDYIATYTKTDTVMKKFDDGCEVYEVIEDRKPLVRCKDCKYYTDAGAMRNTSCCGFCAKLGAVSYYGVDADDFCSFAERREP